MEFKQPQPANVGPEEDAAVVGDGVVLVVLVVLAHFFDNAFNDT